MTQMGQEAIGRIEPHFITRADADEFLFPGGGVPKSKGVIPTGGGEQRAGMIKPKGDNVVLVPLEDGAGGSCPGIPDMNPAVVTSDGQQFTVRT